MRRVGRMPTSSEDVCTACEVQEQCEQNLDDQLDCATTMLNELTRPPEERLHSVVDGVKVVMTDEVLGGKTVSISRQINKGRSWQDVAIIRVQDAE